MQKKTRTPQQDRSIATKKQLFQAALELFAEKGTTIPIPNESPPGLGLG